MIVILSEAKDLCNSPRPLVLPGGASAFRAKNALRMTKNFLFQRVQAFVIRKKITPGEVRAAPGVVVRLSDPRAHLMRTLSQCQQPSQRPHYFTSSACPTSA